MTIYTVCELDIDTGYILKVDPFVTLENAVKKALEIIKANVKAEEYIFRCEQEIIKSTRIGMTYDDPCGLVRVYTKEAI